MSSDDTKLAKPEGNRRPLLVLTLIFLSSVCVLLLVYANFPKLDPAEKQLIRLPRNIEDAKQLGRVLSRYSDKYYWVVLSSITVTYVFLQSFAIPGSIFLSILLGYLFPFPLALLLICTCSSIGASICYLLSDLVGKKLVNRYFPEKVQQWSQQIEKRKENLLNYIIFLRITPFLPNWFINVASPLLNVPLGQFFIGTFIGVAPPSFLAIQGGKTLNQLTSSNQALSWRNLVLLTVFAGLSLLPIALKQRLRDKVAVA